MRERARLFDPGWHVVCVDEELPEEGSQLAVDLLGTPVLVRRSGGELRAFINVCAHRHTRLVAEGLSRSTRIVCPYHGWQYREDGSLGHVPDAPAFMRDRSETREGSPGLGRLRRLALETLGKLVFVSLAESPRPVRETLDPPTLEIVARAFTADHRLASHHVFEAPCNWKVPIENVLETYHVPSLHRNVLARHPRWFELFTGLPDGSKAHRLGDRSTSYFDTMGARSRIYLSLAERLRPGVHAQYEHLHAFPHLVVATTHLVSFVQTVMPISVSRCRVEARVLVHQAGVASWALGPLLRGGARFFMDRVLAEDAAIYPAVQRGLEKSPHRGVLSAREERVHAFQTYVLKHAGLCDAT